MRGRGLLVRSPVNLLVSTLRDRNAPWVFAPGALWLVQGDVPAMVDLPTPPLADEMATTFFTLAMRRFSGRFRCMRAARLGGVPLDWGRPWDKAVM